MVRARLAARAVLNLLRKWRKAGSRDRDGPVSHPETGTPQGGTVSPVLAKVYVPYALDRWGDKVVKVHGRGEALRCRDAEDWGCAFRYQDDAERFSPVLPKRCAQCNRHVAPEPPPAAVSPRSSWHAAALHVSGMRVLLEARSSQRATCQATHGAPDTPGGVPAARGREHTPPAPPGACRLATAACTGTGPLQL